MILWLDQNAESYGYCPKLWRTYFQWMTNEEIALCNKNLLSLTLTSCLYCHVILQCSPVMFPPIKNILISVGWLMAALRDNSWSFFVSCYSLLPISAVSKSIRQLTSSWSRISGISIYGAVEFAISQRNFLEVNKF